MNTLSISSNFITNFKPSLYLNLKNISKLKKNSNQKYCKLFFIYILLFKYKNNFFKKSNIFIKKQKKKVYTILRSPYRHKLARHQIYLNRYYINFSVAIKLNSVLLINNFKKLLNIVFFLKKFNNVFESNLIFINNVKISFYVKYNKLFLLYNK